MTTTDDTERPARADDALEQAVRATVSSRRGLDAADSVHRGAPLREDSSGLFAGVCAAIAEAIGVPVRLTRLSAVVLGLLGPGVPVYLLCMLVMPRASRRPGTDVEIPLRAMAAGRVRPADVVALLGLLPAFLLGGWWLLVVLVELHGYAAVLGALAIVLLALLAVAARRASQARRALVLAQLAHRAGVADDAALEEFLLEQHRRAPWAWGRLAAGDAGAVLRGDMSGAGELEGDDPGAATLRGAGRPRRPRTPRPSGRTVLAVLAGMLAACALLVLLLNLAPSLAPGVAAAPILPQVGRVGAGLAAAAVVAGVALVMLGWWGRRSIALALVGVLALGGAALGATWLRLTVDPEAEPVVISVENLDTDDNWSCAPGPSEWSRPVIIDLSSVSTADAERVREQRDEPDQGISIFVECSRAVGDVTVLMPQDPTLVTVSMDRWDRRIEAGSRDDPVLAVYAQVLLGSVTIIGPDGTVQEEG